MNRSVKLISSVLCSISAVMLVFMAGISAISASALDNNIYEADAHPHYRHSVTGVIEDSGGEGSEVLGQSMTESALRTQSLIEVDPDGNMFATVRVALMDNIQNPQFKVQNDGYSDFYDVSADLMKENYDANESDYRFPIPSENCIVRCTFYVVPMGRDVIFYIDFDNIRVGSGDFVTSVEVRSNQDDNNNNNDNNGDNGGQPDQPAQTQPPQQDPQHSQTTTTTSSKPSESKAPVTTKSAVTDLSSAENSEASASAASSYADTSSAADEYSDTNSLDVQAAGLEIFDEKGSRIDKGNFSAESSSKAEDNGSKSAALPIEIAGGTVVVADGFENLGKDS